MTVKQLIEALGRADPRKFVSVDGVPVTAMTENDACVSLLLAGEARVIEYVPPSQVPPPVVDDPHEPPAAPPEVGTNTPPVADFKDGPH